MYKKHLYALLATLLCCSLLQAQNLESRLLLLNQKHKTQTAPFTEKKVFPRLKKEINKQGMLYFAYPDALSMQYTTPDGDRTLIKDGNFSVRRNGKVQNFSMKNTNSTMYLLRNILVHSFCGDVNAIAKECNATVESAETDTQFSFTLTKNEKPKVGVHIIRLVYDKNNGAIISLCLEEVNANYTLYETDHTTFEQTIPDAVWTIE